MIEDFARIAANLKTVPRQGWINRAGVASPESVADHSYSACVMAMIFGDLLGLDTQKLLRMALLHDLAESATGDITPGQMPNNEKKKLENNTMHGTLAHLPEALREDYGRIWDEFSAGVTPEARLFHEIDRLEMALQAAIYSASLGPEKFIEFLDSARQSIHTPELKNILDSLAKDCSK